MMKKTVREIPSQGMILWVVILLAALGGAGCAGGKLKPEPLALQPQTQETTANVSPADNQRPTKKDPPQNAHSFEMQDDGKKRTRTDGKPKTSQPALRGFSSSSQIVPKKQLPRSLPASQEKSEPAVAVELAFDNADLYEVLDATLYELYKINYMVDPSIKAMVTFHLAGSYTRDQFINILNNVLQLNNLAIVKGPGSLYKIVRKNLSAGAGSAPFIEDIITAAGDVTRLIRLRYLAAATAVNQIRPFLSQGAVIVPDNVNNSVIITDTAENINKAVSILNIMDVPYFHDISWRIFPVSEVAADDIAKDLSSVLKTGGLYNRPGVTQGSFEIIPVKTMNAILVVSRWPSILKLVEDWIAAMDRADDTGTNVFVYFVENGTATELVDILKQLYGGTSAKKSQKTTIVKPEKTEPSEIVSGELAGEVEIIADEINNAIVFKATARDYKIIKEVLEQLDIVPRQVLINAVIAEISLSGSTKYGVEWFLRGHHGDYTHEGVLDDKIGREISTALGSTTGFTYAVFDSMDFLRGLITTLGDDSKINLLSSPNILAVDNKEAVIEVGDEVPTKTGEVTSIEGGTTATFQYRKTGVLLTVTPHINSRGLVKMDLSQEISLRGEFVTDLDNYIFSTRRAVTSLVIEDGQTIVIAGLMSAQDTNSGSGIPVLKDIPVLGFLFGSTLKETDKTELMILITPHVIDSRQDADLITQEFSEKVKGVTELIEQRKL